jgi:bifunctional DNA-binding transcriptional regulator/antitoxin component of YhaV-PrlF toxin-antitoxin module
MSSPDRKVRVNNSLNLEQQPPLQLNNDSAALDYPPQVQVQPVSHVLRTGWPDAASPTRHVRTTAQAMVAALALPEPHTSSEPVRPLPLTRLHELPRDNSMTYGIGRVDASGRITHHEIVSSLNWQPRDRLEIILTCGAIVIRESRDGLFLVPQSRRIAIPATARRNHGIVPGDHVLLAAASEYGVVVVYPLSVLDEMLARYHSAHFDTEVSRHD